MVAKRQRKKGNPAKSVAFTTGKKRKRQRKTEKSSNLVAFKVSMVAKRQRKKGNPAKSDAFTASKKRKRQRKSRKSPKSVAPLMLSPKRQEAKKATTPKRPQTTRQPHLGAAALLYILSAITADHIFSKSSEFFRMDPTSLRWRNRGSKC